MRRHGPAELATRSRSDSGAELPGEEGRWFWGASAWPSPARPTPVLVLGPGSQSAVRALGPVPWPVRPSAAPAPTRQGLGAWGWETPFEQLSRKVGVLKTRLWSSLLSLTQQFLAF